MKHTIEIEGLPEGYEVKNIKVTEKQPWDNGSIAALIYVKKKQPRRIVLEETDDFHEPESPEDMHTTIFPIHDCATAKVISNKKWRIVEDSGENDD